MASVENLRGFAHSPLCGFLRKGMPSRLVLFSRGWGSCFSLPIRPIPILIRAKCLSQRKRRFGGGALRCKGIPWHALTLGAPGFAGTWQAWPWPGTGRMPVPLRAERHR